MQKYTQILYYMNKRLITWIIYAHIIHTVYAEISVVRETETRNAL